MADFTNLDQLIRIAVSEDRGTGDVTSEVTIPDDQQGTGAIIFREAGISCGMAIVSGILRAYDERLTLQVQIEDGQWISEGRCAGAIHGPLRALLTAERVVLNFLQRLSGIATLTSKFVAAVAGTGAVICGTRKTTPGWRELEKYAVRCGGGVNHRAGLYDAVLIKDNHLAALGAINLAEGLREIIRRIDGRDLKPAFVEVEVDTLEQLETVLAVEGVNIVLLDNMSPEQLAEAIRLRDAAGLKGKIQLEASGGIDLGTVRQIAETGVDRISVGALTHSARALDIGLDLPSQTP